MKNVIVVDIDGTVSKVGDRLKYLQQEEKDWDSFYNACFDDEPINEIIELIGVFIQNDYDIVYCTGRRESVRDITLEWLEKHTGEDGRFINLVMRPDGDFRHDTEVKPEQLKKFGIKLSEIFLVLEDRNSMVAKWRELGLKCLQVADGDF